LKFTICDDGASQLSPSFNTTPTLFLFFKSQALALYPSLRLFSPAFGVLSALVVSYYSKRVLLHPVLPPQQPVPTPRISPRYSPPSPTPTSLTYASLCGPPSAKADPEDQVYKQRCPRLKSSFLHTTTTTIFSPST
jgi:hypothetical protein